MRSAVAMAVQSSVIKKTAVSRSSRFGKRWVKGTMRRNANSTCTPGRTTRSSCRSSTNSRAPRSCSPSLVGDGFGLGSWSMYRILSIYCVLPAFYCTLFVPATRLLGRGATESGTSTLSCSIEHARFIESRGLKASALYVSDRMTDTQPTKEARVPTEYKRTPLEFVPAT